MTTVGLDCGSCRARLAMPVAEPTCETACPSCGTAIGIVVFPALLKPVLRGQSGTALLVDDESSCFYHPAKKAVIPCDGCGRFLCNLCDIEMNGRHLCSACIESGVAKDRLEHLRTGSTYYDSIALGLATLPVILVWPTLITAPVALYFAFRYWNKPLSVVPRWRWRFVLAMLLAGGQITLWGIGAVALVWGLFS